MTPEIEIIQGRVAKFLLFKTHDFISATIRKNGVWEELESNLALLLTRGMADPVVIDIGANLGGFTVPVGLGIAPIGGVVHSFEHQRIVYQQLCANVVLNRLDNVYASNIAVGATHGHISIPRIDYQATENIGAVSLLPGIQKASKVTYSATDLEKITVEPLNAQHIDGKCILIKIDVEGYESEVFKGATKFLEEKGFPFLIFEEWRKGKFTGSLGAEIERRQNESRELLSNLGYDLTKVGNSVFAQHAGGLVNVSIEFQTDGILVHRNR